MAHSRIEFLEPWYDFLPDQGEVLQELKRELSLGYLLESLELFPLGHSGAAEDAIFEAEDGWVFQVHLTFSGHTEQTPLPLCRTYSNAHEGEQQVMLPTNEEYLG